MPVDLDALIDPWETRRQPPCWHLDITGGKPNHCKLAHAEHVLRNHVELAGPWAGWRLAGRELVSPDGVRLTAGRVLGYAWREEAEQRLERVRARNKARKAGLRGEVTVVRMPLRDWHAERFGSRAG